MTKIIFGVMVTLLAITMQSCNSGDIPVAGSQNDYEYSFEVSATNGDAHLVFTATTDGSTPLLNTKASEETPAKFYIVTDKGNKQVYSITSNRAREFGVKVSVMRSSSSGTWRFTAKRNGKVIKTDVYNFEGGNDEESKTYRSSTNSNL